MQFGVVVVGLAPAEALRVFAVGVAYCFFFGLAIDDGHAGFVAFVREANAVAVAGAAVVGEFDDAVEQAADAGARQVGEVFQPVGFHQANGRLLGAQADTVIFPVFFDGRPGGRGVGGDEDVRQRAGLFDDLHAVELRQYFDEATFVADGVVLAVGAVGGDARRVHVRHGELVIECAAAQVWRDFQLAADVALPVVGTAVGDGVAQAVVATGDEEQGGAQGEEFAFHGFSGVFRGVGRGAARLQRGVVRLRRVVSAAGGYRRRFCRGGRAPI